MKNSQWTQRIRRRLRNQRTGRRLQLEALESRQVLSNIPVDTFSDVVDPNDDVTSLREAIAQADATSEADTIAVPAGTYQLDSGFGELAIDDSFAVTIQSTGGPATIDAVGLSRVFSIAAGSNVTFEGLVITGGAATEPGKDVGGGLHNLGEVTINDCEFRFNSAAIAGGALQNSGVATVTNTVFEMNSSIYGGAVDNTGMLTVTGGAYRNNTASFIGGGINSPSHLSVNGATFTGNSAEWGGAILNGGFAMIHNSWFFNNSAVGGAGIRNDATLEIANTTLSGNTANYGAGISSGFGATTTIIDTTVSGNVAYETGGGIELWWGTMYITASNVSNNYSGYRGGGIYSADTLSIDSTTISTNTAASYGGGLFNDYYAPLNVTASTFEGNTAGAAGGGLYSEYGSGQILAGSTFLANSASKGGGIYLYGYAPTITTNDVISNVNGGLVLNTDNAFITNNRITNNVGNGLSIEYGYNTIGTIYPDEGNVITGNSGAGVAVNGYSNSIRGNVINSNGGLAIDLGGDGRTLNDPYDGDYGANSLQNHPVLTDLETGATTHVTGQLNSSPYTSFTVDFYAQTGNAPVNPGSAIRYLGSVDVVTDETGFAAIDVLLSSPTSADELVSATATSLYGDTSEMSDFDLIPVAPVSGLVTTEGGAQASFSVVLAIAPTANVSIPLTSSDASEGTVSPGVLTFTPDNWNVPQFATVTGVEDDLKDGVVNYEIITGPAASADSRFDEFESAEVQLMNFDNDLPTPESIEPRGSLVYQSTLEGAVASAGWTESYTLLLDPGQTLSVLVETSETLRGTVAVYDAKGVLVGSATAASTGGDALIQIIRIPGQIAGNGGSPATYRVVVGGADGTTGTFAVTDYLNAALEIESHGGAANELMNSAQDLENSFVSLLNANNSGNVPLPQRGAVLGEISADSLDSADWYRFDLKAGQNMSATLNVLSGGDAQVTLISANGTILAVGSSDRAENFDQVISNFVTQSTGTYYLKVGSELGASYSLVVTRNAGLDVELNDSIATAQEIVAPEVGGRRWVLGAIDGTVVTFDAFDSGSYDARGNTNPWDTDYYTGLTPEWYSDPNARGEHRSYFAFDLSGLTEDDDVLGAQFNVYAADRFSSMAFETLQLSEVTTPVDDLVAGVPGSVGIFEDLGDGTVLGLRDVWSTEAFKDITIDLNAEAVASLNAARGEQFALGGAISSIDYDGWYEIIFAYAGSAANKRQLALTVDDRDFYTISANGNQTIEIETATPANLAGDFHNGLDSVLHLFDSVGNLLATNDNGAPDGRNAKLSYKVPKNGGGTFYIEVASSEATATSTSGEYFLSVKGARTPQDQFTVTAIAPADRAMLFIPPTEIAIDVNDNILLPTLQAANMQIDGVPAEAVKVIDGDTIEFGGYVHEYDGHYYMLTSGPMDWIQAETEAEALGGYLVTINSQEENDFLQRVYFSGPERETGYWTGMNDVASEGTWVWASGEPVTYTNWLFGTPDNYWIENYGEINGYASNGVWNDTKVDNWGEPFAGIIELTALPAGYRVATEGVHTVSIAAGALKDVQGTAIQPFTSTFVLDYTAPQVVMSSIQPGDTLPAGNRDLTVTIGFSETMNTSLVDVYDVTIFGHASGGFSYPSTVSFNETGTEVTIRFEDIELVEDQYSLTLASGAYSFQDVLGLYLDGEYSGVLPSGNGLEGGDFVLDIIVEGTSEDASRSRSPVDPNGSLNDGKRNPKSDSEFVWCNARESHDVNDDGRVSPLDALAIINSLNAEGTRQLPSDSVGHTARLFYDVNRDGFISPRDALQVVNYLNSGGDSRALPVNTEETVSDLTVNKQAAPAIPRVTDSAAKVVAKDTRPAAAFEFVTPPADWAPPVLADSTTTTDKALSLDVWSDPDLRWAPDEQRSELDALAQEAMAQAAAMRRELELQYRERIFEAYGRQQVGSGL